MTPAQQAYVTIFETYDEDHFNGAYHGAFPDIDAVDDYLLELPLSRDRGELEMDPDAILASRYENYHTARDATGTLHLFHII